MAAIYLSGFRILDPIQNLDHLQLNLFLIIKNLARFPLYLKSRLKLFCQKTFIFYHLDTGPIHNWQIQTLLKLDTSDIQIGTISNYNPLPKISIPVTLSFFGDVDLVSLVRPIILSILTTSSSESDVKTIDESEKKFLYNYSF